MDASISDSVLSHTRRLDASEKREENSVPTFGRFRLWTSFESSPVSVERMNLKKQMQMIKFICPLLKSHLNQIFFEAIKSSIWKLLISFNLNLPYSDLLKFWPRGNVNKLDKNFQIFFKYRFYGLFYSERQRASVRAIKIVISMYFLKIFIFDKLWPNSNIDIFRKTIEK